MGVLVLLSGVAATGLALTTSQAASNVPPPPSSTELAMLKSMAFDLSARNGESAPANGTVVDTSRRAIVQAAMGEQIDSNQAVYAVTMQGHFVANMAHLRPGAKRPTGSVLTLVVDSTTNHLLDWSITNTMPDLAKLGAATPLP